VKSLLLRSFALLAASSLACSRSEPEARPRILVVGADGLEWNVLRPLLAQGKCPNLRALMERGSFGHLATLTPTLSPILWTTIATGKLPEQHGIQGFTDGELEQYTSSDRRVRALWSIADRCGLASNVFGWWITWPVEPVRGMMVSGSSSSALVDANWKPTLLPGAPRQVHPESRAAEVMALAEEAGALAEVRRLARDEVFGDIPDALLGSVEKRLIRETLWSIQSDATYYEVARAMIATHPADLNLVYFGGPDVVGHRFWRYHEPEAFRWPGDPAVEELWKKIAPESEPLAQLLAGEAGSRALAPVIPNYYEWFDEMLGGLMGALGTDANVIVLSDHGMHASSTDVPDPRFITGHHLDGAPGVLIAAGPSIVRQGGVDEFLSGEASVQRGSVLSFTPTILALLGIPPARDMPERAHAAMLRGAARKSASLAPVPSHDAGFRPAPRMEVPEEMRASFLERFEGLGYIGTAGNEEPTELVDPSSSEPDTTSPADDGTEAPASRKEP
jgi:hypothetical protein